MTKQKDFKRLVRARMQKTGESYTAARAHLLADSPPPLPDDYEAMAGMSDDAVRRATGKTWPEWTAVLDAVRASEWQHKEIAAWVHENHDGVSGWWAQSVTVSYERFRGLRDVGQRRGGGYDVNKSKTVPVGVEELWRAFEDDTRRARWLPDELTVRTAKKPKSMRVRLSDDSPLDIYFMAKGAEKSTVTLQHRKLPNREKADEMKLYWGERLEALKEMLAG